MRSRYGRGRSDRAHSTSSPRHSRPLVAFGGIWTNWTSVRKAKEGEVNTDIFGFLTCEPNAEVKRVHPKAMPVILTAAEEYDIWLRAPGTKPRRCKGRFLTGRLKLSPLARRKTQRRPHRFCTDRRTCGQARAPAIRNSCHANRRERRSNADKGRSAQRSELNPAQQVPACS